MRTSATVLLVLVLLLTATPSQAHHGWSGYDNGKELTLTGVIRESGYEHPHGHLRLEVRGGSNQHAHAFPQSYRKRSSDLHSDYRIYQWVRQVEGCNFPSLP